MDAGESERMTLKIAMKLLSLWDCKGPQGMGPIMGFGGNHAGSPSLLFSQVDDGRFAWRWYDEQRRTILASAEPFATLVDAKTDAKSKLEARLSELETATPDAPKQKSMHH